MRENEAFDTNVWVKDLDTYAEINEQGQLLREVQFYSLECSVGIDGTPPDKGLQSGSQIAFTVASRDENGRITITHRIQARDIPEPYSEAPYRDCVDYYVAYDAASWVSQPMSKIVDPPGAWVYFSRAISVENTPPNP